jgi:rRNA maturation endonuclease Nob1
MDDFEYEIQCSVCDSITHIITFGTDNKPEVCPMCGGAQESIALGEYESY